MTTLIACFSQQLFPMDIGSLGVLLTGRLQDGTLGMQAVKQHGGVTIIQDPDQAAYSSMPRSAQAHCQIDYCLPLGEIAPLLQRLVGT